MSQAASQGASQGASDERCLEIVSDDGRDIPDPIQALHPEIPWNNIKGVGGVLRHDEQHVTIQIMWPIATVSVPELKVVMLKTLAT